MALRCVTDKSLAVPRHLWPRVEHSIPPLPAQRHTVPRRERLHHDIPWRGMWLEILDY